jgi:hypothetical protein
MQCIFERLDIEHRVKALDTQGEEDLPPPRPDIITREVKPRQTRRARATERVPETAPIPAINPEADGVEPTRTEYRQWPRGRRIVATVRDRKAPEIAAALDAEREKGQGKKEAWRARESEQEEEEAGIIREENRELVRAAVAELATGVHDPRDDDDMREVLGTDLPCVLAVMIDPKTHGLFFAVLKRPGFFEVQMQALQQGDARCDEALATLAGKFLLAQLTKPPDDQMMASTTGELEAMAKRAVAVPR